MIIQFQPKYISELLQLFDTNSPTFFHPSEKSHYKRFLHSNPENYFVITEKDAIIAAGGFDLLADEESAQIAWDLVHPNFHKKGYGSQLLTFRINGISQYSNIRNIRVRTTQLADGFYKKYGFNTENVIKNYWAEGFDLVQMRKQLR